jgi:hypothetical protein
VTTTLSRRAAEPLENLPEKPYYKRWWFVPAVAVAVLLGMFVLGVVAILASLRMSHYAAVKKVNAEVARIQASGEPITTEDFYAWHKVPPGTPDITQDWLKVLASLDEESLNQAGQALPFFGEVDPALLAPDAPGSQIAAAEKLLADFAEPLAQIHAAAELEGQCRYPIEFAKGIGALLPHAQEMRSIQRLLQMDARVRMHRGDIDGALVSIAHMLKAAQTLDHQTTLIEHLVRLALYTVAFSEIEFLMNETQLTETQLADLQKRLDGLDLKSGLTTGMIGERGMGFVTFEQVRTLADVQALGGGEAPGDWEDKISIEVGRPNDCLKYLELLGEMIAASREPFPVARQQADQVEKKLKTMVGTQNPLERLQYVVTSMLAPAIGKAFDAVARVVARRDALVSAIAAERHRLQNGSYPAKLDDLVPAHLAAVPTDPFTGQPLRMISSEGQLVVYSVGPNGIDDQGVENEHRGEPDIVVKVGAK